MRCFAQHNEIGTHLLSYSTYPFTDKYSRISVYNESGKPYHLLNGITYKRHIHRHILRGSFTYRELSQNQHETSFPLFQEGKYNESILKFGYERDLGKRNLTPYVAADIALLHIDYLGVRKGDFGPSLINVNGLGAGFSAAFGLKLKLSNSLSLNAESCLDWVSFKFDHNENLPRFGDVFYNTYKEEFVLNPLQKLSLNVRF